MSRIALELHSTGDLSAVQRSLIKVGCRRRDDRVGLEPILRQHSRIYSAVPNTDEFWQSFSINCLRGQNTDCGHWLYNIVLGMDWFEGASETQVQQALGI
jgi:hypothetical protein